MDILRDSGVDLNRLWMFYGYANTLITHASNFSVFKTVFEEKRALRELGVNIVGRVSLLDLRKFLGDYAKAFVYPVVDGFEETFCNSVLEASRLNCLPIAVADCAVQETLTKYSNGYQTYSSKTDPTQTRTAIKNTISDLEKGRSGFITSLITSNLERDYQRWLTL